MRHFVFVHRDSSGLEELTVELQHRRSGVAEAVEQARVPSHPQHGEDAIVHPEGGPAAVQVLGPHAPVAEIPRRCVLMVSPADSLEDVFVRLRAEPGTVAVVVDHGAPVGMVTFEHLLAYLDGAPPGDRTP